MAIKEVEKDGKKVLEYRFQPKLDDGTPIGGEQVVYGATHDELMDAAANNYTHIMRKNREFLRDRELSGKAPDGVKLREPEVQFNPRPLTADERMRLSRELSDPEKIDSALDLALEAKFGAKPQQVSQTVDSTSRNAAAIRAAQEAEAWRDQHPDFYASQKNVLDIASWVKNRNMEFTIENLNKAYEALAPALEQAPPSSEGTQAKPPEATAASRITETGSGSEQRQPQVPPASVSRKTGTTRGTPVKKDGMTADKFRRLPEKERREFILSNPGFDFSARSQN